MDKEEGERKKMEFAQDVLNNDLFPHCHNETQKIYFLGYMTKKLLMANEGFIQQDDRDSYLNKRIDLPGTLLNNLFRNYFNKLVKDMQKMIIKEINTGSWRSTYDFENIVNHTNIYKIIKSTTIENGIKRALSTGDFGLKHTNSSKVGVAQVLNRMTYASSLSHSRRISTPIDKSGKLIPPRMLHNTTWGFLCPAETPEGQSVGVVKNLSYLSHLTIPVNRNSLHDYITSIIIPVDDLKNTVKYYNKDENRTFPKHRFKKFIKDVVKGTIERNDVINDEISNHLYAELDLKNTDKDFQVIFKSAIFEFIYKPTIT